MQINIELLTAAKELISKGWCQGQYHKEIANNYEYCTLGALEASPASYSYFILTSTIKLFKDANNLGVGIVEWNDDPKRTKEDVLNAFDKAIEYAK